MKMKNKFNLQHAILGFINTGVLAFIINLHSGNYFDSIIAGFFQGLITFLVVGVNTAFFEYLYFKFKNFILIILPPCLLTSSLSFLFHYLLNSPAPLNTALGIFLFAFVNFTGLYIIMNYFKTIKPTKLVKLVIKKIKNFFSY